MKLFIKISKDGKAVQVLKTIFSNTISEEEFNKKSERLTSREFITRFSKNIDEGIINKIERLREIYEMKLSALGNFNIFNKENQIVGIGYFLVMK